MKESLVSHEENENEFDEKTKRKVLISCLLALAIGNMMLDNVYAILPKYVDERDKLGEWSESDFKLDEVQTTTILIMFSVAQLIFAPLTAWVKNKIGAKNTISAGFFLMTITTFGLGGLTYI